MTWAELPAKLKIYIASLCSLALIILISAVFNLLSNSYESGWILLTLFVLLTVPTILLFQSASMAVGIGDAYIMAISMIYGAVPCIIATFLHTLALSISKKETRKHFYKVLFNISSMVCGACLYSNVYHLVNHGSNQLKDIIIPAAAMVTVFFLLNSILISIAISWSSSGSIRNFWVKSCVPIAIDFLFSASSATVFVLLHRFNTYAPLGAAPIILIAWGWIKLNQTRVLEAEKHLKEQEELYLRTVESLAVAVEVNDETTYGHIRRVKVYANELARLCGVTNPNELKAIQTGALLHDIGKLVIDDYILNKPGRLSKQEFEKVKMHVQAGNEILQQIQFPFPVAEYVGCHHERWDGLGYPNGLKGEQIPLGGRILAIADAFDAIRYSRPYKLPVNIEEAIEMLRSQSGTAYDPRLVQLFIENIDELEKLAFNQSKNMPELSFRQSLVALDKAISDSGFSNESSILNNCPAEILRLAEFCSAAAGCLDYSDLFPILSRRIESLIALSACTFYLDNGSGWVEARYAAGAFSEMLIKHKIPMGKGISGWVAAHRQPMFNTEPALEFQELEKDFSVFKNAMAVPIILGEECLGAICVYGKDPAPYSSDNLGILKAIAGFAAPAIAEIRNRRDLKPEDFIDPATRLHRFSYLTAVGPQLLASAEKSRAPVSAVYFEIRNMHRIFRTYGADAGNSILKGIADCIKPELRETDILVRYGNRAFVAILPGMRDDQALRCIERLRQQIRMRRFHLGDRSLSIDCAAGFSSYPNGGAAIFSLIQSAQQSALSKSHKTGASANKVIGFKTRF